MKNKKIAVLMGGLSKEREISFKSGRAVATALRQRDYQVVEIDVDRTIAVRLKEQSIDLAVIMLHGRWGEDGTIQGMLEVLGIPYTGSGPLASAIGIDKDLTKKLVQQAGYLTPDWEVVQARAVTDNFQTRLLLPVIVKPNREGSTIGISIVKQSQSLVPALREAARFDETLLIEQFISGMEVTVGLVNGKALPVLEIVPKSGFYDFQSKYTKGMTEYIVPARIPEKSRDEISRVSEEIFKLLGLAGIARADFILKEKPYFLEINTIPGMTETSLVPKAAQAAGISFETLCEQMVEEASLKV